MIVRIDTLEDVRLDAYARLTEAQLRNKLEPEKGIFIAESGKVIERALEGGMQPLSLLMEEKWLPSMAGIVERIEQIDPAIPARSVPARWRRRARPRRPQRTLRPMQANFPQCALRRGFRPS